MCNEIYEDEDSNLILASEDFTQEDFVRLHHFSKYEDNIIRKLMAHGPVLLKGGRGTGKSALLREANRRVNDGKINACGIYLSLRHLPLLRTTGKKYENELLLILIEKIRAVAEVHEYVFYSEPEVYEVHKALTIFANTINKRIVIFFDDAAHIGREAGLEEFFDVFRTLSNSNVSCKAAIYPGVTRFGNRFDIYNDATVIEICRREEQEDFEDFFYNVLNLRFDCDEVRFTKEISKRSVAKFIGKAVLGNVRSFVRACSTVIQDNGKIGYTNLTESFLNLSRDFYWPMIEEIQFKIGIYENMIEPATIIAEKLYSACGEKHATSCIIHKTLVSKFAKPLEILEYSGFISKREASRGMKSGGRGTRYALNLCNVLEYVQGSRITKDLYENWTEGNKEDIQFAENSMVFSEIQIPELDTEHSLSILDLDVSKLKKSNVFPYGLTDEKISVLKRNNIQNVGDLAGASDEILMSYSGIGIKTVSKIRSVVGQAIWM